MEQAIQSWPILVSVVWFGAFALVGLLDPWHWRTKRAGGAEAHPRQTSIQLTERSTPSKSAGGRGAEQVTIKKSSMCPSLSAFAADAKELVIFGSTLQRIAEKETQQFLTNRAAQGTKMTFVLLNPSLRPTDPAIQLLARHRGPTVTGEDILREIQNTLTVIENLRRVAPDPALVVARVDSGLPTLTLTVVNFDSQADAIRVMLRPYRVANDDRPVFDCFQKSRDGLFQVFRQSFQEQLKNSVPL